MFLENEIKNLFDNYIFITLIVISWFLIFRESKKNKENKYKKDFYFTIVFGFLYGVLAVLTAIIRVIN